MTRLIGNGASASPWSPMVAVAIWAATVVWGAACSHGRLEVSAKLSAPAPGLKLDPGPPEHVHWVRLLSARLPPRTRGEQQWDEVGGLPDPYVVLSVDGRMILRTKDEADTLEPTWPDAPRGNIELGPRSVLRLDVYDADGLHDQLIGTGRSGPPTLDQKAARQMTIEIGHRGRITLAVEPAHARFGLGLSYRLQSGVCHVTNRFRHGPAGRANVKPGDRILAIGGAVVDTMQPAELRSLLAAIPMKGLGMGVLHETGTTEQVTLVEGPIYPLFEEYGSLD